VPRDTDEVRRLERVQFDKVPAIYDRVRPSYPPQLFADLFARFDTSPVHVLEIGPGTGQATRSLLDRGARVTAVEPGANLAAFLRRNFAGDDRLTVINSTFEDAVIDAGYDLVFAATSFHWVDPDVRFQKAQGLLRPGGWLAIVSTVQISSDADRGYFARSQPFYRRYFPDDDEEPHLHDENVIPDEFEEVAASGLFRPPELFRYRWDQTYVTADYADLMRTYGAMQTMAPDAREGLISDLSALIDAEFGGLVTRPLVITLTVAQRD
jgi:SAM-dependent methyltransferase